jgi:hypothetical protein
MPQGKIVSLELDKVRLAFDELTNIWQLAISGGTARHCNRTYSVGFSADWTQSGLTA